MARQALAVSLQRDLPRPRLAQPLFQLDAEPGLVGAPRPPFAARAGLTPVPAQETDFRFASPPEVAEARDVRSRWPPPVDVLVFESRNDAARARFGDMVHEVVADLAARVGEAGREARALRIQEDLGGGERRGAEKDDPAEVLVGRLGLRVDDAHPRGPVTPLVVDHTLRDRVGDHGQSPGLPGGG